MTLSASSPPVAFEDVESAIAALRAQGLRVTMARRLILQALFAAAGRSRRRRSCATAGDARRRAGRRVGLPQPRGFRAGGVVRHVHLGHGPGLYALVGEGEREYLYCERCGSARAVSPGELDDVRELVAVRFGYSARSPTSRSSGCARTASRAAPQTRLAHCRRSLTATRLQ